MKTNELIIESRAKNNNKTRYLDYSDYSSKLEIFSTIKSSLLNIPNVVKKLYKGGRKTVKVRELSAHE